MTRNSYHMRFQSPWFTQKFEGIGERFKGPGQSDLLVQEALDQRLPSSMVPKFGTWAAA